MAHGGDILRGHTETIILRILSEGDSYGYEICKTIIDGGEGIIDVKDATIYTAFKRMEEDGLLITYWGDGVGGYASGPMLKAAQKRHIPTLIQEQNSYAGVTNKLLAARADVICVAYEGMDRFFPADKIVLTGNPVRRNLVECQLSHAEAVKKMGLDPSRKTILVVGGSLGARTLNESVAKGIDLIKEHKNDVQVVLQTGKYYDEEMRNFLVCMDAGNVLQMPFITDMDIAYRAADLVVSRAGAGAISELQLLGKPVILVPSPNVAEDHQTKNAQALVAKDAAIMVRDADARDTLAQLMMDTVADEARLASLASNIEKMALRQADSRIVDEVDKILQKG